VPLDGRLRERIRSSAPTLGCNGKRTFETMAAAWRHVELLNKSWRRERGEAHAYRCPVCHGYHYGRLRETG
jgi:hypothetical protein